MADRQTSYGLVAGVMVGRAASYTTLPDMTSAWTGFSNFDQY
jgi:hypothetical protein